MNKDELRNYLFKRLLNNKDGMTLKEINDNSLSIMKTFDGLKEILLNNSSDFEIYNDIEKVKLINYKNINYLIIKIFTTEYIIIDIDNKKIISDTSIFEPGFFAIYFNEVLSAEDYHTFYHFDKYEGNISTLLDYYYKNKDMLELEPLYIKYSIKALDGKATIFFDLASGSLILDFSSKDNTLYEQLYLKRDLKPSNMQDAVNKIGKNKMYEYFNEIKNIYIPKQYIPNYINKPKQKIK